MNKILKMLIALAVIGGAVAQADLVLIDDTFTTSSVVDKSRVNESDIDTGNWVKRDVLWEISGGTLSNPATLGTSKDSRGAYLQNSIIGGDSSLTQVTVSFDYTVSTGSTLYFYTSLIGDEIDPAVALAGQVTGELGTWSPSKWNLTYATVVDLDGTTSAGTIDTALATIGEGTGSFSQTFALADGQSIADYSDILAVFTTDGNGAVAVDNLMVTAIPEPATIGMLGLGAFITLAMRKKLRA